MDHSEATATNAPERYLLGELTAAEADAFEEHYFDCAQCADDLRVGSMILEGGRQLVREEVAAPPAPAPVVPLEEHRRRRWPLWASNAAAAVMAFALVGTWWMRPPAVQVAFGEPQEIGTERSDGGEPVLTELPAAVELVVIPEQNFSRYEGRVVDQDGKVIATGPIHKVDDPVMLTIGTVPSGRYRVEIYGAGPEGPFQRVGQPHYFRVALSGQ